MEAIEAETGGHRVQRVPRTERRGRVHSSTVTVAVLDPSRGPADRRFTSLSDDDFQVEWYSGTVGAGGQNHQKTQNCARVTHVPTGLVRTAQTRSRRNSLDMAMKAIREELHRLYDHARRADENLHREAQVGMGERSDRRRTWAFQRDVVDDFRTGKSMRCQDALRGRMDRLWR